MNDLISLNTLFNSKLFRIPDYQRGYSWTYQQLEDFWNDLYNLRNEKVHYTGMISLKKLNKDETKNWDNEEWLLEEDYSAFHIVDGQQRLTTIVILINEIVNYYRTNSKDDAGNQLSDELIYIKKTKLSDVVEKYLYKIDTSSSIKTKTYKFGYEKDNPSNEFFKHKILGEKLSGKLEETFYTLNLEYAKSYFHDKLQKEKKTVIEELYKKLTQFMQFNIYYINDDFNVFMAFETMNNRGKPLSYLELLKNRLIYLSTLFDEKPSQKNIVRNSIMDSLKVVYMYLGKNKNNPLSDNEFLQNHWMIYFKYTRSNKVTYSSFLLNDYFNEKNIYDGYITHNDQEKYEDTDDDDIIEIPIEEENLETVNKQKLTLKDIEDYVLSLKDIATYWYRLYNPSDEPNKKIRNYLERFNILGFANFKPLITVILSKDDISSEKKVEALKAMERFVFLYHRLSGVNSTKNNSTFYGLAHKLYYNEINIDILISEINKMDILSSNNVISSIGILNKVNTLFNGNNLGFYSWATLRYLLFEYEKHLMSGKGPIKLLPEDYFKADDKDTCSIEHIYPQNPEDEYWIKQFINYNDEEKYRLSGSLGNLLPLSKAINSAFQNDPFEQKKNGTDRRERCYSNGCYSEIEVSKIKDWNATEILNRGLKLVDFMENEWNFHFTNKAEKIKFLGLDFMIEDNNYKEDVYTPIYIKEEKENKKEIYNDVDDLLYLIMDNEEYASGYYKNGRIIVKAGSKIRMIESPDSNMREKVEKGRLNPNIENGVYVLDTVYDNPSYAANIILGNNKNGWTNWKNKDGITLNDLSGRSLNEDRLLKKSNLNVINIYNYLKNKLLEYSDEVKTRYVNNYIAFYIDKNFIEIHPRKDKLECYTVNKDIPYRDLEFNYIPKSNRWSFDVKFYLRTMEDVDKYWRVIIDSIKNTTK